MKRSFGLFALFLLLIVQVSANTSTKLIIKGYVLDEDGNPLTGVLIYDKGKTASAIAKEDGYFELNISEDKKILQIDYVGFDTGLHEVVRPGDIQVIVLKSNNQLEEVVVTERGMGSMKRRRSVVVTDRYHFKGFNSCSMLQPF